MVVVRDPRPPSGDRLPLSFDRGRHTHGLRVGTGHAPEIAGENKNSEGKDTDRNVGNQPRARCFSVVGNGKGGVQSQSRRDQDGSREEECGEQKSSREKQARTEKHACRNENRRKIQKD